MTELLERYRRNAEKCRELVQNFNEPEARRALLVMANAWLVLAAQRAKNVEIALPNQLPSQPQLDKPPNPLPANEPLPAKKASTLQLNAAKPDDQ